MVYETIIPALKNTGNLDCIDKLTEITETTKHLLKTQIAADSNFKKYKKQLDKKKGASYTFELLDFINKNSGTESK